MSERKILFLHPTYDCSMDKVCRDDCYLLAGKSEEEKKTRLPDEYWVGVLNLAIEYGFEELSLPINPLRGITGVKDPLYWLRLLAPIAKEANMVVNVTTTAEVASKFTEEDGLVTDIVALSLDSFRAGKSWTRAEKKFSKVINHLRAMDIEVNCNLSLSEEIVDAVVQGGTLYTLLQSFDYFTPLWPKMRDAKAWAEFNQSLASVSNYLTHSVEGVYRTSIEERELLAKIFSPVWDGGNMIPDYCYSFTRNELQCSAGHGMLSINAEGQLAICAYNDYYADVSTLEKFEWYLEKVVPKAENITYCDLIRPLNGIMSRYTPPRGMTLVEEVAKERRKAIERSVSVLKEIKNNKDWALATYKFIEEVNKTPLYNMNRPGDAEKILIWACNFTHGKKNLWSLKNGKLPSRYMKVLYKWFPEFKYYDFATADEIIRGSPFKNVLYYPGLIILGRYRNSIKEIFIKGNVNDNPHYGYTDTVMRNLENNPDLVKSLKEEHTVEGTRIGMGVAITFVKRWLSQIIE